MVTLVRQETIDISGCGGGGLRGHVPSGLADSGPTRALYVGRRFVISPRALPPASRHTDPATSHQAEFAITRSGARVTQAQRCHGVVLSTPGLTAGAIGERTGLGHVRAQRRLSDLKSAGRVRTGPARDWRGHGQVTWWPVEEMR